MVQGVRERITGEPYEVLTCDHSDLQCRFNVREARGAERGPWEALMNVNTPAPHFSLTVNLTRGLPIGPDRNSWPPGSS